MSQLTTYPLADWFKATLDQSYNGTGTTIYVDDVPNITRPSGVFTYLVIAPKTSNQQIVKLSWFDTIGKTFTVSSTTVKKWAGTNYSTFTHAIGTEVIISSNYAFWEDIKTAINDNATNIATNTASIAAINNTINTNINTIQAGSYISANSTDWDDTYDATLSPAITAYTDKMMVNIKFTTVNTWACTLNLNGLWAKSIKTKDWNDPQNWIIRAWWVYQLIFDGTNFIIQNEDFATTANKGIIEIATDTEANTWTDTTLAITPSQLKNSKHFTIYPIAVGGSPLASSNGNARPTSATYTKVKEILVSNLSGSLNVYFTLNNSNPSGGAFARIYKNGVAVGTERNVGGNTTTSYEENISVTAWDLLQIYAKDNSPWFATVSNFRIYGSYQPSSASFTVNI